MIIVKSPMRISFVGGGTDYPAHYVQHGGAVLGMAIDKYCWITLRKLPPFFPHRHRVVYSKIELVSETDEIIHPSVRACLGLSGMPHGLEVHHDADLPARSGMGSSSAFTVGLLNALAAMRGEYVTKRQLAEDALMVEQEIIKENVGSQDQIWAAFGGLNRIDFLPEDGFAVKPLIMSRARRNELVSSVVLYFTGFSRDASEVSGQQMQRVDVNASILDAMRQMVDEAERIICTGQSLRDLGSLLNEAWRLKKTLSTDVTTSAIDNMYAEGIRAGAWGGKLLGAGSGGFRMFLVPYERRASVRSAMRGRIEINVEVDYDGSKVVLYQPDGL